MSEPFDPEAERRFVAAVIQGQQEAVVVFEERIRCVPRIMAALNARRGRPFGEHDLADLAQNTVMIAFRKLPEYEPLAPLEGWLYRMCCYEFLNALRRRDRDRRIVSTEEVDDHPDAAATDSTEHDEVHLALERLGGIEAEIIRLKHFDELTFAELATRLAIPENTAKTRYYRGLDKLERLLGGDSHEEEQ